MCCSRSGEGISRLTFRPIISSAGYPKTRTAAGFTDSMMPRSSMVMIPSAAESRIARSRASFSVNAASASRRWEMSTCEITAPPSVEENGVTVIRNQRCTVGE